MAYTISGMVTDKDEINALFDVNNSTDALENTHPNTETTEEETPSKTTEKENTNVTDEESPTIEDLFGDEVSQERVGNEDDTPESEERESSKNENGSSPAKLYSSIANSLAEEGALSNLSDDDLKEVKDSSSLIAAMKKQVYSMLDDTQKRIQSALDAGMENSQIKQFEGAINYLDNLTDEQISEETPEGENLRKALIYQYQMSLGVSEERAHKMVERAFSNGTDVEDAKDYVEALKDYYKGEYKKQIDFGNQQLAERKKEQEESIKKFKDTLLNDKKILGDIEIDDKTRQLAFDNWMKPTHKTEQGDYQSAIQKYIAENPADFQMKVALLFTMTDGFTKMGKILNQTVKKEKKKAMQELENVVNNTQRTSTGTLNMFGGIDDNSSFNGLQIASPNNWKTN